MPTYRASANKWIDKSHPQTLYAAVVLLYVNAALWLLWMFFDHLWLFGALAVGAVFGGLGLANEKKEGYWLSLAVAIANLVLLIHYYGGLATISFAINILFAVALLALLLHPMTRSYRRIWFKNLSRR